MLSILTHDIFRYPSQISAHQETGAARQVQGYTQDLRGRFRGGWTQRANNTQLQFNSHSRKFYTFLQSPKVLVLLRYVSCHGITGKENAPREGEEKCDRPDNEKTLLQCNINRAHNRQRTQHNDPAGKNNQDDKFQYRKKLQCQVKQDQTGPGQTTNP